MRQVWVLVWLIEASILELNTCTSHSCYRRVTTNRLIKQNVVVLFSVPE